MKREQLIRSGGYIARPWWLGLIPSAVLSEPAKVFYCLLLSRLGNNEEAWPGWDAIAFDTGLPRSTLSKHIDRLHELGLVKIERRKTNHYTLTAPPELLRVYDELLDTKERCGNRVPPSEQKRLAKLGKEAVAAWGRRLSDSGGPDIFASARTRFGGRRTTGKVMRRKATVDTPQAVAICDDLSQSATVSQCATSLGHETGTSLVAETAKSLVAETRTTKGTTKGNYPSISGLTAAASAKRPQPFGFTPPDQAEGAAGPTPSAFVPVEVLTAASPVVTEEYDAEGDGPEVPCGWSVDEEVGTAGEDGVEEGEGEACPEPATALAGDKPASDPVEPAEQPSVDHKPVRRSLDDDREPAAVTDDARREAA